MENKRKKLVHVNLKDLGFKEIEGLSEYSNKLLVEEDVDIKEYAKNETAPYGGEDVVELANFINVETPEDEYFRKTRDLERSIMYCKNSILESSQEIIHQTELMNVYLEELGNIYQKYTTIINGCSKEDNIH
jgi:hypothetical protein